MSDFKSAPRNVTLLGVASPGFLVGSAVPWRGFNRAAAPRQDAVDTPFTVLAV